MRLPLARTPLLQLGCSLWLLRYLLILKRSHGPPRQLSWRCFQDAALFKPVCKFAPQGCSLDRHWDTSQHALPRSQASFRCGLILLCADSLTRKAPAVSGHGLQHYGAGTATTSAEDLPSRALPVTKSAEGYSDLQYSAREASCHLTCFQGMSRVRSSPIPLSTPERRS